jgi:hypothetical protein
VLAKLLEIAAGIVGGGEGGAMNGHRNCSACRVW